MLHNRFMDKNALCEKERLFEDKSSSSSKLNKIANQTDKHDLIAWQQQFINGIHAQVTKLHLDKYCQQNIINPHAINTRLQAYDNNYQLALVKRLTATYKHVHALVGEGYFTQLCRFYLDEHPLRYEHIFDYGAAFPNFIATQEVIENLPYLSDMARLDWSIQQSYYAKNRKVFDSEHFQQLTDTQQEQVIFIMADDVTIMASEYPLYEISLVSQGMQDELILTENQIHFCMVKRPQYQVQVAQSNAGAYQLYQMLSDKKCLADIICSDERLSSEIGQWLQKGWITGFYINTVMNE